MSTNPTRRMHIMRLAAGHKTPAETRAKARAVAIPSALAPGLHATKAHDLIFHGGHTIQDLLFHNFFVGGQASWNPSDVTNINAALAAAMGDRNLNNVIQQYFHGAVTSKQLGSEFMVGTKPAVVSQGDAEDLITRLFTAGKLKTPDFSSTVFNLILPQGTILNDNPGTSTGHIAAAFESEHATHDKAIPKDDAGDSTTGLGGYHGSVRLGGHLVYYAVGVYSERRPDGTHNGIPVFDAPWKNVVGTFYHELNEARTDPDVEEGNHTGNVKLIGWTSRQGEEIGDFPISEATSLSQVFQEVPLTNGNGKVPVQFEYSNAVHGPEGPIPKPH